MSEIDTLMEMGFSKEKAERALQITEYKGVQQAMDWLLAHADEDIPPTLKIVPPTTSTDQDTSSTSSAEQPTTTNDETTNADDAEAKSLKCDECNRLFKNQMEVEFHAAKSGHTAFSESTEEKKPLSEEERRAQLTILEAKIKEKRVEREENEKKEALEREKHRIKSGKDMLEARTRMEELEMKKIIEQRKREKQEEKEARDRVNALIEADKMARRAKMTGEAPPAIIPPIIQPTLSPESSQSSKKYLNTKIQIRLQNGSTITETFDAKEPLSAVRLFIQLKQGNDSIPFGLMTSFPRKIFTEEDYEKPLEILELVPSAVVIVTKA